MALMVGARMAGGGIFELSEAEQAFNPWWSALEGYATFSILIVGMLSLAYKYVPKLQKNS